MVLSFQIFKQSTLNLISLSFYFSEWFPRKARQLGVGHVFSHEFSHPAEDRPTWDFETKALRLASISVNTLNRAFKTRPMRPAFPPVVSIDTTRPQSVKTFIWGPVLGNRWRTTLVRRLVVNRLYMFGFKHGVRAETMNTIFIRLNLQEQLRVFP